MKKARKYQERDKEKEMPGSFTVEASWIMAFVFIAMVTVFQNAARMHDETTLAMNLHQAVEKGRHGTLKDLEKSTDSIRDRAGILMAFPEWNMAVTGRGRRVTGIGEGGMWVKEIEAEAFRPEIFLRKITLVKELVEQHEN